MVEPKIAIIIIRILADFNLVVAIDRQTAKFNSPPNFLAMVSRI